MVSVLSNPKDLTSTDNIIAANALDTASAQQEVVGSLYGTIGLMGQLAVLDFCYAQQVRRRCLEGCLFWQSGDDSDNRWVCAFPDSRERMFRSRASLMD